MASHNLILVDKRVNPPFYCNEGTSDYLLQKGTSDCVELAGYEILYIVCMLKVELIYNVILKLIDAQASKIFFQY